MSKKSFSMRDFDPQAFDKIVADFCYRLILETYAKDLLAQSKRSNLCPKIKKKTMAL